MQDYYAERLGYGHHRSQMHSMRCPYPPIYYDQNDELQMALQYPQAIQTIKYESEDDSDDDNEVEKAMRAHARAAIEYEKIKEKLDDAKKKVDECAAKLKVAKRRFKKDRKVYIRY